MQLTRRQAWLLVGAAAWTWYVWLSRIWNIVADQTRTAQFKAAHIALAVVSVVLLTPVGLIGIRGIRRPEVEDPSASGAGKRAPARRP
jgi:hypothetical protein